MGAQRAAEQRSKALIAHSPDSGSAEKPIKPIKPIQQARPRVWPYPGGRVALERPFKEISGRRHVPKLINANKIPILQFKKPQSPFLSRIIRDSIKTRQKRADLQSTLLEQVHWAQGEDDWDRLLRRSSGVEPRGSEDPWSHQHRLSHDETSNRRMAASNRRAAIAAKMHTIVEQEKALANEEKLRRLGIKRARRLARTKKELIE